MTRKASRWEGQALAALQERWDRPHIHLYTSIDSTNSRTSELADEGAPPGTLVVAEEQTAGRGSAARRWHSAKGAGLYLSMIMKPSHMENVPLISLLAGLGAAVAIERLISNLRVGIKWPNDVIVQDRKVGGVLSEASWAGGKLNYVVVGVGINVLQQPSDFPAPLRDTAISLATAAGQHVSRLKLADLVIREVEERCANPPQVLDRESLKQFDDHDWLRDRRCALEMSEVPRVHGTVAGVAPDGALLFRPDRGALIRVTDGRVLADDLPLPNY